MPKIIKRFLNWIKPRTSVQSFTPISKEAKDWLDEKLLSQQQASIPNPRIKHGKILKEDMDIRRPSWEKQRPDMELFFEKYNASIEVRAKRIYEELIEELGMYPANPGKCEKLLNIIKQNL